MLELLFLFFPVNFHVSHLLGIFEARLSTRDDVKLVVRKLQSFVYPNGDGNGAFLRVLQHRSCLNETTNETLTLMDSNLSQELELSLLFSSVYKDFRVPSTKEQQLSGIFRFNAYVRANVSHRG